MPANQIMCSIANQAVTISEANNIHKHYENLLAIKSNGESLNHLEQNQLDDISLAWFIYRIKSDSGDQVRKKYIQKFFIKESFKLIGHFIKLIGALILAVSGFSILSLLPVLIPFTIALPLFFMSVFLSYMGAPKLVDLVFKIYDFISTHIQNYLQSKKLKELEPLTFTLVINEYNTDFPCNKYGSPFLFSRLHILDPNLQHIDSRKFSFCTTLTRIVLPNSLRSIGDCAFSSCTSLTHVTIPNSVIHIGDYAFSSCTSLTQVTIPNSLRSIGDYAFISCTSLTHVTIPNSVIHIGNCAFYNCTSLTQVTIPNSVIHIGNSAFVSYPNLQIIAIDDSNQADYQRIVNQLPLIQQHLARPWSELKAAQETKQQALKSLAALSMRGIMTHLLLKLSIKKGQEFLSVWQLLPRRLWVLEEWRAFSIRDGVLNQNLDHFILKKRVSPCAPGFATMLKKINIRMAVHLNSAVAEIPLPTSQEEREILFERVRETALPYSRRMLLKPLQINQVAENCLDEDNHVASP